MAFLVVEKLHQGEGGCPPLTEEAAQPIRAEGDGGGTLCELPVSALRPNPAQPRRHFDREALLSLSESIRQHGLLQPPVVRSLGEGRYELIAGERRWRAAMLAGLSHIPCLLQEREAGESAELAIIENLQRRDLDLFEEAAAIAALCEKYHMTQEQVGARLAVSQSYIANKLRLLRLSEEAQQIIRTAAMTERHARAVLRLPEEKRLPALRHMAERGMNVAGAEKYVEQLLAAPPKKPRRTGAIKDIRLFYNSVDRAMQLVRESGIGITAERHETEAMIEMVIRIPKRPGK